MEQGNSSMRDRLLARLPQPENLAAYREEVATGLKNQERWLSTCKWIPQILFWIVFGVSMLYSSGFVKIHNQSEVYHLEYAGCMVLIGCVLTAVNYFIQESKVDLLKEVKQVQLQVLELQASLRKSGDE